MKKLKIGQKVTYTREYAFGKTSKETATVITIRNGIALLSNGDEIGAWR